MTSMDSEFFAETSLKTFKQENDLADTSYKNVTFGNLIQNLMKLDISDVLRLWKIREMPGN